jgi:hypothetical protein
VPKDLSWLFVLSLIWTEAQSYKADAATPIDKVKRISSLLLALISHESSILQGSRVATFTCLINAVVSMGRRNTQLGLALH